MATTDEANALLRHENDALREQLNEAGGKMLDLIQRIDQAEATARSALADLAFVIWKAGGQVVCSREELAKCREEVIPSAHTEALDGGDRILIRNITIEEAEALVAMQGDPEEAQDAPDAPKAKEPPAKGEGFRPRLIEP